MGDVRVLCKALGYYYSKKGFAVCLEVGLPKLYTYRENGSIFHLSKRRADFVAVSLSLNRTVIVETKSCWADFTSDSKWTDYRPHCNQFYFAADLETATKIKRRLELCGDTETGVIAMTNRGEKTVLKFIRRAKVHDRVTPWEILLWQMAVRSSRFGFQGKFTPGNIFEAE